MFFPVVLAVALTAKTNAVVEPPSNLRVSAGQEVVMVQWNGNTNMDYQVESLDFGGSSTNWEPIVIVNSSSATNFTLAQPRTASPTKLYRVGAVSDSGGMLAGKPTYTITASASPSGSGVAGGSGSYAKNASATVTATSTNSCYSFTNWTESGTNVSSSANYTFTVTRNRTLVANFVAPTYSVTTTNSPSGGGTTSGGGTKNCGSSVTVTATPASCYGFVNWTENGTNASTSASYTFTASGNRTLVANFALTTPSITTSSSPSGGGTTSGGGAVSCGSSVTVTATANSCYTFVNWTEGATVVSTSPSYTFTANNSRTLVANFALTTYSITTSSSPSGGGTTSGGGTKNCGSSVTVTATANSCYTFVNWTEGATVVSTSPSYTFTANSSRTLVANFALATYSITTSSSPSGGGATSGGGTKNCGSSVTVTATANSCYTFVNWTEGATVVSTSSSYTFTASASRTLVANFALTTYSITTSSSPSAGGSTSGGGTKNCGSSVTVTATPNGGYNFVNWTEGATVVGTSPSYTFTASANRTLVANFTPVACSYTVATSVSPSGSGTASPANLTTNCGSSVTVTAAVTNSCRSFLNWTEGGTIVSTSASYTFATNVNRTLVANFVTNSYAITTSSSPSAGGTTSGGGTKNCGSSVTVTATTNSGYNFVNWTEGAASVSASASYTFTASANRTLVANFTATLPGGSGITSNLAGYWTVDTVNVSGTTAVDTSGNTNNGSLQGAATIVAGQLSQAVNLDGASGLVNVPNSTTLNITGPFTVAGWVNFSVLPSAGKYPSVIAKFSDYNGYGISWNGGVIGQIGTGSAWKSTPVYTPVVGVWNHYACAFEGTSLKLYVNGALHSQITNAAAPGTTANAIRIGGHYSNPTSYGYINGKVDDARVYNRALSAADITELYNYTGSSNCTYTITTSSSPSGGGTTSGGGAVSCGSSVTVTATANSCYTFVNWTEGATVVSTSPSYTFTANNSRTLVANFALTTYSITTSSSPSGGGTTSGGGTKNCGSSVTVTATANSCYTFVNWTEGATVVSTSPSYTFTANSSRTLVANFALATYSITTSSSPSGGGATSGGGTKNCGSSVTVTATANSCYTFVNWTEGATVVSTSSSYTFTASVSRTLVANFALTTYSITTSSSPSAGGSTSGGGTKNCGSSVTVTATPNGGYNFVNWTEGATVVGTSPSYKFTAGANRTLVANFSAVSCTYSISPTNASFIVAGGSGSVSVTTSNGCSWTSTNNGSAWITITSGASGTSSGTVNYSVSANTGGSRSGTLTIAGQTFTVNQAGSISCTYALSSSSAAYSAAAATGSVNVITTTNCSWTATTSNSWVTITSGATGTGNGTVAYSVTANTIASSRSGVIVAAGQAFTILQLGSGTTDSTVPVATYLSPTAGSVLSNQVQLVAKMTDNLCVARAEFYIDIAGQWVLVGTGSGSGTVSTNSVTLDSATVQNGPHTLLFKAIDALGNFAFAMVSVTVSNITPDPGNSLWFKETARSQSAMEARGNAVKTDSAGNIINVGSFRGTVTFGAITKTNMGGSDAFLAKYDPSGTLLWVKTFGGNSDDSAAAVTVDAAGNIYITGYFFGTADFGGGPLTSGNGIFGSDVFVAKYASDGTHIWSKRIGGAFGNNEGNGIALDSNGNVIVGGKVYQQADLGGGVFNTIGSSDGFVVKLAGTNGVYIWGRNFGSTGSDYVKGVAVDSTGDVFVAGYGYGNLDLGGGNAVTNAGSADLFIAKYAGTDGHFLWSRVAGSSGPDTAEGVAVDSNQNVFLTGSYYYTVDFGGVTLTAPIASAVFIAKYDTAGTLLWARSSGYDTAGGAIGSRGVAVDASGNVVITGNASGGVDFGSGQAAYGDGNFYVAKYNPQGNYLWAKRSANTGFCGGYGVTTDMNRNVLVTGFIQGDVTLDSFSLSTPSTQIKSSYLLKTSP